MGGRNRSGVIERPVKVTPDDSEGISVNMIPHNRTVVDVQAVTNDANDFIVLPPLSSVPNGHRIIVLCNAGGNFEVRTPAASGEKIATEDADGSVEYLAVDAEAIIFTKISTTDGWQGIDLVAVGGVGAATNPD